MRLIRILLALGFAFLLAYAFIMLFATSRPGGEFQYRLPDGWRDLRKTRSQPASDLPQQVMADAASGRFAFMAVDPRNTRYDRLGSTFNAVETTTTGRVTEELAREQAAALGAQVKAAGLGFKLVDVKAVKIDGVPATATTAELETPQQTRTLLQYVLPGRKIAAVLSYSAPKEEFSRYLPVFEASAQATRGGYDHGSYHWERGVVAAGIGGAVGLCSMLALQLVRRRRDAQEAAEFAADGEGASVAAAPKPRPLAKSASKYVWICPECDKPVPMRLTECRCGGAKPA